MYASKIVLALAASSMASASIVHLAERVAMPESVLEVRASANGWSLQSSSAQSGLSSCGNNAYCPSGTTCNAKASAEVAACCTGGDCRGEVEGAPKCADSAWSLWKGYNGNGFCCLVGEVGVYDSSSNTAGTCVSSAGSGVTPAVLMSTGTGSGSAPATTSAAPSSSSSTAAAPVTTSPSSVSSVATTITSTSAKSTSTGVSTTATISGTSTGTTSVAAATNTGAAGKVSAGFAGVVGALALGLAL